MSNLLDLLREMNFDPKNINSATRENLVNQPLNYQYKPNNAVPVKKKGDENYETMFTHLKKTDEALLNSILSFAVYDRNGWMMENMNSSLSDIAPIVKDAMKDKEKMYGLKVWHFIKNTFEKIPDADLKIPAHQTETNAYNYQTEFTFKDGQYSAANGLAHAAILKSKDPNGEGYILHVAFRGTEFSRLKEYLVGPYLDMSAYYQNFKPLEKYLQEYANDPKNNITQVQVNGHSLGGAMVQEFLKNNPAEKFNVPVKGFTFGSPGSEKKWYHKFLTAGFHAIRGVSVPEDDLPSKPDDRITQFYHTNDPVPLVGLLGYTKGGNNNKLEDVSYEESKQAQLENKNVFEKIPAFGKMVTYFKETVLNRFNTKFHDSARYIMNLRNHIENFYVEYEKAGPTIAANTDQWQNWIKQERNFSALSIRNKGAFEYLVAQDNPNLTKDQINDQILEIRQKMRYDSQADIVLSKTRSNDDNYSQFIKKGNVIKQTEQGIEIDKEVKEIIAKVNNPIENMKRLRELYNQKMEESVAAFRKPS